MQARIELNDLIQAGYVGLVNASRSFKSGTQVPFATYARYRIRGEIIDSLRRLDGASRNLRHWQKQMDATSRELTNTLHRDPTEEEISETMGVRIAQVRHKKLALRAAAACWAPARTAEDPEKEHYEYPSDRQELPDALQARSQMRQVLADAMMSLPTRSRLVLKLYYDADFTMRQIGERLSVNESRISQIHKCALQTMARTLRSSGINSCLDL
jgi:RNA polymerase sigma factor for flagellar operon FliA